VRFWLKRDAVFDDLVVHGLIVMHIIPSMSLISMQLSIAWNTYLRPLLKIIVSASSRDQYKSLKVDHRNDLIEQVRSINLKDIT
jgi:hypothetical protein